MRHYCVWRLDIQIETGIAVLEFVIDILAPSSFVSGTGVGNRLAVSHQEHIHGVLWNVCIMGCNMLIVIASVHLYGVQEFLA